MMNGNCTRQDETVLLNVANSVSRNVQFSPENDVGTEKDVLQVEEASRQDDG